MKKQLTLNVALIGFGYAGRTIHAPLLNQTTGLHLVSIVSSDAFKVAQDFGHIQVEKKAADVFANPDIDLVVIATPNHTHFDLAYLALEMDKHVIIDKPIAISGLEASELIEIAQKKNRLISVFQNRRWDADFLTVRKILETNVLGEISQFQSSFNRYRPNPRPRWREQDFPGSGLWFDLGSHLVDQAVLLFGSPDKVYADMDIQRNGGKAVDYFQAILSYGTMRVILQSSSFVSAPTPRFAIHGQMGSYIKNGFDIQEDHLKQGKILGSDRWGCDPNLGNVYMCGDNLNAQEVPNLPGDYLAYYAAIRDCILLGETNPVNKKEILTVMKILELGIESAQHGKTLTFNL